MNIKYKDSVFSFLFSDPDLLRELYCAIEGVTLPEDIPVTINTLKDVLYMELINDISFVIGGKLVVLIEHQSTINPNMAIRLFLYSARVYEKMFENRSLYSSKPIVIPRPEFFMLYNGIAPYPDQQVLRLSDSFEKADFPGFPNNASPSLELLVKVININEGRNAGIAAKCRKLAEYSAFIAKVRSFEQEMVNKEAAFKAAIKYCRNHDILKEFLATHSSEVFNMLLTEWNTEDAKVVWYEEGLEDGLEKGRQEGRAEERHDIAQKMKDMGLPAEQIASVTGIQI